MVAEGYSTKIIADSMGPAGKRLTTWELTYPRFVHAELMTHRLFARNAASSRAIPVQKMIERVYQQPVLPVSWGKNQRGMQAEEELTEEEAAAAQKVWLRMRDRAIDGVQELLELGVHKQLSNRPLEAWMFITVILSSTEFENWFGLRDHKDAQPELAWVAKDMRGKFEDSKPQELKDGEWHLPYISEIDRVSCATRTGDLQKISTGRCARVSYLTHDGKRDLAEDISLHDKLSLSGHWSPFEHTCQAMTKEAWERRVYLILATCHQNNELFDASLLGNITGWLQYRKTFPVAQEMRRKFNWPDTLQF